MKLYFTIMYLIAMTTPMDFLGARAQSNSTETSTALAIPRSSSSSEAEIRKTKLASREKIMMSVKAETVTIVHGFFIGAVMYLSLVVQVRYPRTVMGAFVEWSNSSTTAGL